MRKAEVSEHRKLVFFKPMHAMQTNRACGSCAAEIARLGSGKATGASKAAYFGFSNDQLGGIDKSSRVAVCAEHAHN